MITLFLYIHFPWCVRKCPYCDFNSYSLPNKQKNLSDIYVDKLLVDLEIEASRLSNCILNSIYLGGGTPSLLSPDAIKKIIDRVKTVFSLAPGIEITLEANPGTINLELCKSFKDVGINRISLGVQSFDDAKLKSIGRAHNALQTYEAISSIKQAGFLNFNLDLMFGLPNQSTQDAIKDLEIAIKLMPTHLSWYQLTLEPNTQFATKPPILPKNEELWSIQQAGQDMLIQSGLLQYEVSAYSKPGFECRHNVNYWQYGDYLGIGAGSHSKITSSDHDIKRYWKIAHPKKYLQARNLLIAGTEVITLKKRPFEFMLNALRLYRPISYTLFQERTGSTIDIIASELAQAKDLGLIEIYNNTIITTAHGKNFLNNLLEIFLYE